MRRRGHLVVLACFLLLPACAVHGLNFKQDKRLEITAPKDRAKVHLPFTIRWRVHDFRVTGRTDDTRSDRGYFGVYVDRAPQPPNESQESLLRNDFRCRVQHQCTQEMLDQADIHATTAREFAISSLPAPPTNAAKRRELHDVTIVLLDGRGERIGESAFRLQIEIDRSGTAG